MDQVRQSPQGISKNDKPGARSEAFSSSSRVSWHQFPAGRVCAGPAWGTPQSSPLIERPPRATLRSKGRDGSCAVRAESSEPTWPNYAMGLGRHKPDRIATLRRAESSIQGQLRRTGQAPGCAANFPGDMASTLAVWAFVTGAASKRTAVELGGGNALKGGR